MSSTVDAQNDYRRRLETLKLLPEPEAAEALRKALLKGTTAEGLTFMRADILHHYEHVHHYYGCPGSDPCDKDTQDTALPWEKTLMIPMEEIIEHSYDNTLNIHAIWSRINLAVVRLGTVIRERWLRMNDSQRKAILLQTWPELPPNHRPDMDRCLLKACPHQRCAEGFFQYAFPHLNLEDMTAPNSLLILLNARTRHAPFKFALSDAELAPLLKLRPALLENTKYTMGLIDEDFGKIVEWDTVEEASEAIVLGNAIHPVHGMHILITQIGLYEFLVQCIARILPDKLNELNASAQPCQFDPRAYSNDFSNLDIAPVQSIMIWSTTHSMP